MDVRPNILSQVREETRLRDGCLQVVQKLWTGFFRFGNIHLSAYPAAIDPKRCVNSIHTGREVETQETLQGSNKNVGLNNYQYDLEAI